MANTILTPQIIANEALMVLQANLVMADLVHRDYSREFAKVGDTITIRKPAKFISKNFTGTTSTQDIAEGSTTVSLDRYRDITVDVSSKEMTLDIRDFSEQVITPAMQAHANAVDADLLAVAVSKAGKTISATANPTNLKDIADMAKALDTNKAPVQNRRLVLHPTHKYAYALTDNLSKVSYAGDNQTLRDALLGRVYTLDTYMDQNAPDTTAATAGTATAYKVTATAGATAVKLTDVTAATGTVKAGDGFIVDGYIYHFTADATAASGTVDSVEIDQPIHKALTAAEAALVKKPHSVAFHRNGLALVTRDLELPMGASNAAIASADGLSVRVVYGYDMTHKVDTISFDILYGVKDLDDNLIVALA